MTIPTKNDIDHAFRTWLVQYLTRNDISQFRAAVLLGVAQSTVHNIVSGKKNASDTTMRKMLDRAGVNYQQAIQPNLPAGLYPGSPEARCAYKAPAVYPQQSS